MRCDKGAQGGDRTEPRTSPEPLLVAMVMNRPTDAVRQESPSNIKFADDIMRHNEIYNESRENLERWRSALERRGRKEGRAPQIRGVEGKCGFTWNQRSRAAESLEKR